VPEDAFAVNARAAEWHQTLRPQDFFHCWLIDQIAIVSLRIEHNGRIERRQRDRAVLRAEMFWDDDRRLEAEELGERLAFEPAKVANQLRRTPQGCDWMIGRWARLARIAEVSGNVWDKAQRSLAFDLLGVRSEDRSGRPGETFDAEGRPVEAPESLAELARREVAGLLERKKQVAPLDALDRTLARADYADPASPEVRELRRRDAALHRQMKWYLSQLYFKRPYSHTDPKVYKYFFRDMGDGPPPEREPLPPAPDAEASLVELSPGVEIEVEVESIPMPDRREVRLGKAEARRESRRRKLERLRA
jgi:hypothetical protein